MARSYGPDTIPACKRDYWKRPPNQNQGDANQEMIFQAVGKSSYRLGIAGGGGRYTICHISQRRHVLSKSHSSGIRRR